MQTVESFVTTEEAAAFLNRPPSWLRNNAAGRKIPRYKVGNQWRFQLSEVAEWVKAQSR